jgi:hypothetical protein
MHAGKTLRRPGATPLLTASSRPKVRWGRSRPPRAARGRVLASRGSKRMDLPSKPAPNTRRNVFRQKYLISCDTNSFSSAD